MIFMLFFLRRRFRHDVAAATLFTLHFSLSISLSMPCRCYAATHADAIIGFRLFSFFLCRIRRPTPSHHTTPLPPAFFFHFRLIRHYADMLLLFFFHYAFIIFAAAAFAAITLIIVCSFSF